MMRRNVLAVVAVALLSLSGELRARTEFFRLDDLKPGMKGIGRTVFQGTTPEEFQVEILGVMRGVGPGTNAVLARFSGGPLERTGVFEGMSGTPVFIDGKLLGAVAFVEQSPWAREVGAAVNLEARGTSGPSLMFETGSHSLWLMPLFARAVPRPLANSLYYAIYRRLPNDTDFSVFKKHGFDGFNFAFIGDVSHYHTPLDNLRDLDAGSLQSQGDHALGQLGNDPTIGLRLAGRGHGLAYALDAPFGIGERDLLLAERGGRQHHMGEPRRVIHEQVLHHQQIELPELAGDVSQESRVRRIVAAEP